MTKKLIGTILFIVGFVVNVHSQTSISNLNYVWAVGNNQGGTNISYAYFETTDASGNVYVAGTFMGTVDFDPGAGVVSKTSNGNEDVFLSKFDQNGVLQWNRTFGGTGTETVFGLELATGTSLYLTGTFISPTVNFNTSGSDIKTNAGGSDVYVTKISTINTYQYTKQIGGAAVDDVGAVAVDNNNNVLIFGRFMGTVDFDPNAGVQNMTAATTGLYMLKLTSGGNFVWSKMWQGSSSYSDQENIDIKVDASNNYFIVGEYFNSMDFDPNAGVQTMTSVQPAVGNIFLLKLDQTGNYLTSKSYNCPSLDVNIELDNSGNVYLTAMAFGTVNVGSLSYTTSGPRSGILLKLDNLGNILLSSSVDGTGADSYGEIKHFVENGSEYFYTLLYTATAVGSFVPGMHVVKLNTSNVVQFYKSYDPSMSAWDIDVNFNNDVFVCGFFNQTRNFDFNGTHNLVAPATNNAFVAKYNNCEIGSTQTSADVYCEGTTASLSSSISGLSYSWSGPNSFTSVLTNPTVSNFSTFNTGNYIAIIEQAECKFDIDTIVVTMNNAPVVSSAISANDLTPCLNSNLNFFAPTMLNTVYAWSGPNGFTSSLEDPTISNVSMAASGTYSLDIQNITTGCHSVIDPSLNVTVQGLPGLPTAVSVGDNTPCEGDLVQFSAPTITNVTYAWSGPNGFTSSLEDPTISNVTTAASGIYSLQLTDVLTGCIGNLGADGQVSLTVQLLPIINSGISVGDNTPCEGDLVQFSAPTVSNVTYAWSGPNGFTSSLEDPTISNVTSTASGTYSLQLTDLTSGCQSLLNGSSQVALTVQLLPIISVGVSVGDNTPCEGDLVQFSAPTVSNVSYSWSGPNGFTSSLEDPTISNVTSAASGTYSLQLTDLTSGCQSLLNGLSQVALTVQLLPIISGGVSVGDNTPCEGDLVQFSAPTVSNVSYSWSGPNGFTSSLEDPTISNVTTAASGTYSLQLTDLTSGCQSLLNGSSQVALTVQLLPIISGGVSVGDNTPCEGDLVQFSAPTVSNVSYSWSGPNGFTSSLEDPTISNVTTAASGTYSLQLTDLTSGCQSLLNGTSQVALTVQLLPIISGGISVGDNTPCEGDLVQFSAPTVSNVSYSWSGPNGFTSSLEDPTISNVTTAASGTYSLQLTDLTSGCQSLMNGSSQVALTVQLLPIISGGISVGDNTPCEGELVQFSAPTIINASYSWFGPNGFVSILEDPTIINVTTAASGTYNLYVVDNITGCVSLSNSLSQVDLDVTVLPVLNEDDSILFCYSNTGVLTLPAGYDNYQWSNGGTDSITTVNTNGWYGFMVTENGCSSNLDSVYVELFNQQVNVAHSANGCYGDYYSFMASGGGDYSWIGPNGFSSNDSIVEFVHLNNGNIGNYALLVSFDNGCQFNDQLSIEFLPNEICHKIPEIITPNIDGLNEAFVLEWLVEYPNNRIVIFNRWGSTVYESQPYQNDFTGVANKGIDIDNGVLPNGTYFFLLYLDEESKPIKGTIEIQK